MENNVEKKWYVVNTYSGHENKVKEKLEMRASSMGMEDYILRVVVPEQTEVEIKDGVQKEKVKKIMIYYGWKSLFKTQKNIAHEYQIPLFYKSIGCFTTPISKFIITF